MSAKFFQFKKNLFLAILLLVIFVLPNNALAENLLTVGSANSNLTGTDSAIFSNIGSISATTTSLIRLQKNGVDLFKVDSTGNVTMGNFLTSISAANVSSGAFGSLSGNGNYSFPGNVGIGTMTPAARLNIYSTSSIEEMFRLSDASGSSAANKYINWYSNNGGTTLTDFARIGAGYGSDYINSFMAFSVADSARVLRERVRINVNGNVGIGDTAPSQKLAVSGSLLAYQNLSASDFTGLTVGRAGSWSSYIGKYANIAFTNSNSASNLMGAIGLTYDGYARMDFHSFYNGAYGATGPLMSIRGNGNVGIGNPSPGYKLDVNGEANFGIGTTTNRLHNVSAPTYGTDAANKNYVDSVIAPAATTTVGLQSGFWTTGANGSIFNNNSSGKVGIGTTNPGAKLNVDNGDINVTNTGSSGATREISVSNVYGGGGYTTAIGAMGGASYIRSIGGDPLQLRDGTDVNMTILGNGNVGIGTTTPNAALDIFGKAKITNNGIIYNQDSLRWLDMTGTLVDSLKVAKDIYSTAGVLKIDGTGNSYVMGNLGIGIGAPAGRLHLEGGDLLLSKGNYYNSAGARYGGKISLFSSLKGRQVNNNPDFLEGLNNYNVYDNASSGTVSLSLVSDSTAPNSSGRVMRLSVSGAGASPGRGGFYKATPLCGGTAVGHCLRQGNRHVVRIWAKIPADSSIQYASNSMGTGGSFQWISSRAGTGEWEEYIGQETMGAGAATTNFFYVADGAVPLTWDVASVEIIDIDSLADVDRAASLNVGYKNDIVLGDGNLLSTAGSYFAVDSGNVGIGLTNPSSKLQINPGTNTEGLRIITSNYSPFVIRNASDTADIFRIDQNGNITGGIGNSSAWTRNNATSQLYVSNINDKVGIGTTNPIVKLQVEGVYGLPATSGTTQANGVGRFGYTAGNAVLDIGVNGGSGAWLQSTNKTNLGANYPILLNPNGGNVGIGTTTPGSLLTVGNNLGLTTGGTIYGATSTRYLDLSGAIPSASLVVPHSIKTEEQLISTVTNGTAPLAVNSNTLVSNLNADLLDGSHAADFQKVQVKNILKTDLNPTSGTFWYCLGTLNAITNGTKTDLTIESMNGADSPRIIDASIFTAYTSGRINVVQNMALSHSGNMASWGTYKILVTSDNKVWLYYVGSTQNFNLKVTVKSSNFTFASANEVVYTEPTTVVSTLTLNDQLIVAPNLDITARKGIFAGLISPKWYPSADSVSALQINKADGTTNIFNVDTTNSRIGIGITNPGAKLDVDGAFRTTSATISLLGNSGDRIVMTDNSGNLYATSTSVATGLPSPSGISGQTLRSNGTSWVANNLLYNNGTNVGIGTTNPGAKLDISSGYGNGLILGGDNSLYTRTDATTKYGRMAVPHYTNAEEPMSVFVGYSDATNNAIQFGGGTSVGNAATILQFFTAANNTTTLGTERMRINSSGNVGIGNNLNLTAGGTIYNSDSSRWLDISGSLLTASLKVPNSLWSTNGQLYINGTGNSYVMGNLGIGTTNPAYKLDVNGGIKINGSITNKVSGGNSTIYRDVASYVGPAGSIIGTMKITLPIGWTTSNLKIKIEGTDNGTQGWEATVSGGNWTGGAWLGSKASISQGAPFTNIRLAYDGSNVVVLLGNTSTNWQHTRAMVTEVSQGLNTSNLSTGWSISIINDETGISSVTNVPVPMYINSAGNVGIGTTAPSAKLDVNGDVKGNNFIGNLYNFDVRTNNPLPQDVNNSFTSWFSTQGTNYAPSGVGHASGFTVAGYSGLRNRWQMAGDATATPNDFNKWYLRTGSGSTWGVWRQVITDDGAGNVGIGTANPGAKLDVNGDLLVRNAATFNSSITLSSMVNSGNRILMIDNNGVLYSTSSSIATGLPSPSGISGQTLRSNGTSWIANNLLYNNGTNVGIGTTNPSSKLDIPFSTALTDKVTFGNTIISNHTDTSYGGIWFGVTPSATNYAFIGKAGQSIFNSTGFINFAINNAEKIRITSSGNVGIGLTAPQSVLDVNNLIKMRNATISQPEDVINKTYLDSALGAIKNSDRKTYNSVVGDDGTDGWYSLFQVNDANTSPVMCNIRAYAHSSASFIVSKGYSANNGLITILNANTGSGSTNGSYKFLKGVRITSDGTVQIKLNGGATVDVSAEITSSGKITPQLFATLTKDTGTPTIIDVVDPIVHASIRTVGPFYSNSGNNYFGGRVGIGTTAPNSSLTVTTGGTSGGAITFRSDRSDSILFEDAYTMNLKSANGLNFDFDGNQNGAGAFNVYEGASSRFYIAAGGNVGIASTSPSALLTVGNNFKFTTVGTLYGPLDDRRLDFSGLLENSLMVPKNIITTAGKLGIGTTAPGGKAEIAQGMSDYNNAFTEPHLKLKSTNTVDNTGFVGITYDASTSANYGWSSGALRSTNGQSSFVWKYHNNSAAGVEYMRIASNGSLVVDKLKGTGNRIVLADSTGSLYATSTSNVFAFSSSTPLNMNGGDIRNVNKLTVGTIDPLYRINGTNYSSFASAIVGGVKEEYLGRAKISQARGKEYEYRIDFTKLSAPNELWVWRQTVDFSPENVEVSLTPYGAFANIYYIIEDEAIVLRADRPATVSYRLVGKRIDWQNWPTRAKDQQEKPSFIINNGKVIK